MKKVSSNEKIIVDFLKGENYVSESEQYIIKKDCVYAKTKGAELLLFYKEGNKIFYRFAENNKNYTKKILPLINDELELYLMHREIAYPKIRKDVFSLINKEDMLHSILYTYIEGKYYDILYKSGHDFLEILFKQVKEFDAEEEMFSDYMTKNINRWTKPKINPDYDGWRNFHKLDLPLLETPVEYFEMSAENLKRVYKINSLIS